LCRDQQHTEYEQHDKKGQQPKLLPYFQELAKLAKKRHEQFSRTSLHWRGCVSLASIALAGVNAVSQPDRATVENMFRLDMLPWALGAAAGVLIYQLCLPPIVGLADQGDFAKIIGHFGYGPEDKIS